MDIQKIKREVKFKTARSSGSGGQHVNKVATKVELIFAIDQSEGLEGFEKRLLHKNLKHRINKAGVLLLTDESSRSQNP